MALTEQDLQKIDQLLVRRLEQNNKGFNSQFKSIDQRFKSIDEQFKSIDQRFEKIDQRFEKIDQRFEKLEHEVVGIKSLVINLDERVVSLEEKSDTLNVNFHKLQDVVLTLNDYIEKEFTLTQVQVFDNTDRIDRLEKMYARYNVK